MTEVTQFLDLVTARVRAALAETYIPRTRFDERLLWGKRLRARMAFHVGQAVPAVERAAAAAAAELFHTASLLHDDVIDGALVRRGIPADCAVRGAAASVLLGDRLIVQCLRVLALDAPRFLDRFLHAMGEICDAEMEHESLIDRGAIPMEQLVNIARRKTGGLFAFVGWACGGDCADLATALESCGYALGLAYQFADDQRDAAPEAAMAAGKTLGTDCGRGKPTLAGWRAGEVAGEIAAELRTASDRLADWPAIADAWRVYVAGVAAHAGCGSLFDIAPVEGGVDLRQTGRGKGAAAAFGQQHRCKL
jgi:geranylgeranyl pyrophosphate synthase